MLKDVNVKVFGHSNDVVVNGQVGYTSIYDKSKNTISVAETFRGVPSRGFLGQSRTLRDFPVAVEHNTAQALGSALDDKLKGAGSNLMPAMTVPELIERGITEDKARAGKEFFAYGLGNTAPKRRCSLNYILLLTVRIILTGSILAA